MAPKKTTYYPYATFRSAACKKKYLTKIVKACGNIEERVSKKVLLAYEEAVKKHGIPPKLIQIHTQEIGNTLFLHPEAKPIKKRQFVGVYAGNIILIPEGSNKEGDYFITLAETVDLNQKPYTALIDGACRGNYGGIVNHSSTHPNLEFVFIQIPHLQGDKDCPIQIALFALRTIEPGEMLLINYGPEYWNNQDFIPYQITNKTLRYQTEGMTQEDKNADWYLHSKSAMELLVKHRHVSLANPEKIPLKPPIFKLSSQKWEDYQNDILERGIPRNLYLKKTPKGFFIFLRPEEKPIKKGDFIGLIGGTVTDHNTKGLRIETISIDLEKEGNFSKFLPIHPQKGNIQAVLRSYLNKSHVFLVAKKNIEPGEKLILQH